MGEVYESTAVCAVATPARAWSVSVARERRRSGGCSCEAADAVQCFDEVGEERVAGRETQDESSPGAADRAGDGDETEAKTFRVAGALALRQGEQLQPGEQVEGEQRDEQIGPVGMEARAGQIVEAEPELGLFDLVFEVRFRAVPCSSSSALRSWSLVTSTQ